MELHIGKLIQKRLSEMRIGPTEFARMINTSKQNVYAIFKRKSIDTDQLFLISKVLRFNFFLYYTDQFNNESDSEWSDEPDSVTVFIREMRVDLDMLKEKVKRLEE
jgi:hypothetical protein